METCKLNKCPLNRVVTVHEIGFTDSGYMDSDRNYYNTPTYFVEREPRKRDFTVHAIKEIGNFTAAIFKFRTVEKSGLLGWLGECELKMDKTGEVSGGWVRLDDGSKVFVSETADQLKKIIEDDEQAEQASSDVEPKGAK